jgi:hypothetical protein
MDKAVPLHDAAVARDQSSSQTGLSWSAFFQSLGQSGPDRAPDVSLIPIVRFATSA